MQVLPGSCFCAAHGEAEEDQSKRVPCPLDPRHSVNENKLQQHLRICTKKRDADVLVQQPFFRLGANAGEKVVLAECRQIQVEDLSRLIENAFRVAVWEVLGPDVDPQELLHASILDEAREFKHSDKHDKQNQALAKLIAQRGLAEEAVVIEYGCGRGGLTATLLEELPGLRCVLVDREHRRHKIERRQGVREEVSLRLTLDIADFDLEAFLRVPAGPGRVNAADFQTCALSTSKASANGDGPAERLEALWATAAALRAPPWPPRKVLVCAKHLCGAATDVSLRSLLGRGEVPASVCIATCCHHRCEAASYVNCPFLHRLGLCQTVKGFTQFAAITGWAVGGRCHVDDVERRRVGMMAKRILDLGRVAWARETLGLPDASLSHYVDKEVTPENIAITAGFIR